MDNWDEIRTAYQVARMGTVSGAAEVLGVHHATVIRHIDALEGRLGLKLFQRHARGYTATEAGEDLLTVAKATDDQFTQLVGRLKGRGDDVTGELVITSLAALSPLLAPSIAKFQIANPGLVVRYLTGERIFRLEYGEAHVAVRAGAAPEQLDNVVQPFFRQKMKLVAHKSYIDRRGMPVGGDLSGHDFVGHDSETSRAPFMRWLRTAIRPEQLVFRTTDNRSMENAILSGAGVGFLPAWEMARHKDLIEVAPSQEDWSAPLWLVTHVDLHRSIKVQAFLNHIKAELKTWSLD